MAINECSAMMLRSTLTDDGSVACCSIASAEARERAAALRYIVDLSTIWAKDKAAKEGKMSDNSRECSSKDWRGSKSLNKDSRE